MNTREQLRDAAEKVTDRKRQVVARLVGGGDPQPVMGAGVTDAEITKAQAATVKTKDKEGYGKLLAARMIAGR